jgi:hypothetical protein
MSQQKSPGTSELEWVQLQKDMDKLRGETAREKFVRKIKDNPVVPVGE